MILENNMIINSHKIILFSKALAFKIFFRTVTAIKYFDLPPQLPCQFCTADWHSSVLARKGSCVLLLTLDYPLQPPVPNCTSTPNSHFLWKMDDFWLLRELHTCLRHSTKDFSRFHNRVPPSDLMLQGLETRGFCTLPLTILFLITSNTDDILALQRPKISQSLWIHSPFPAHLKICPPT